MELSVLEMEHMINHKACYKPKAVGFTDLGFERLSKMVMEKYGIVDRPTLSLFLDNMILERYRKFCQKGW